MQHGMTPRKLTGEFRNGFNDDPQPRQAAHGRAQRGRVHPLATGIHGKGTHQTIRHATEKNLIEPFGDEKTAIIPQGLLAEITIRLGAHIQCMVPGHVERQSLNGGRIAQIVQVLQEQNANDDVQILRGAPEAIVKMRQQFFDRKIIKKVFPEHPRPRTIKQTSPLVAHFRPAIKQITGPSVAQCNHARI